jgi:hypothetical protein
MFKTLNKSNIVSIEKLNNQAIRNYSKIQNVCPGNNPKTIYSPKIG